MTLLDSFGRPMVYVQRCDHADGTTWFEVVDRRLPTSMRIISTYNTEKAAVAAAEKREKVDP